jgi:hypothetical protein
VIMSSNNFVLDFCNSRIIFNELASICRSLVVLSDINCEMTRFALADINIHL